MDINKRILIVIPIAVIIYLTWQSSNQTIYLSNTFSNLLASILHVHLSSYIIRKIGHTIEYFFLGLTAVSIYEYKAILLCGIVSILDQTMKIIVPGRHFDVTDFPFDILGYVLGIVLILILKKIKGGIHGLAKDGTRR